MSTRVRTVLGTMTWSPNAQTDKTTAIKQLQALVATAEAQVPGSAADCDAGKVMVDTARVYQSGETEELIGELFQEHPELRSKCTLHTKANPGITPLTKEGLWEQMRKSLAALQMDCVDILYLHSPDIKTNYEETFAALDEIHKAGHFVELGLSNFASWDCVRIHALCKQNGWIAPTVYQGLYNAITRSMESELLPALRVCGIRSYWYNPLAGGLLTGRYSSMDDTQDGRFNTFGFAPGNTSGAKLYKRRYWKEAIFEALEVVRQACEAANVPMAEAAIRWTVHHSVLKGEHGDGIIFGASSLSHAEANLRAYAAGPLPDTIVDAYDQAWEVARPQAESYMRGYGKTPGGSELFLARY